MGQDLSMELASASGPLGSDGLTIDAPRASFGVGPHLNTIEEHGFDSKEEEKHNKNANGEDGPPDGKESMLPKISQTRAVMDQDTNIGGYDSINRRRAFLEVIQSDSEEGKTPVKADDSE